MKLKSVRVHTSENHDRFPSGEVLQYCVCIFTVNLRCVGGEVGATSSLAPKIGPLGLVSIYLDNCRYTKS